MANRTVKDAKSIRGTNPQYLIEKIIRSRIYDSKYWKEECFALTAELLVDKAMDLRLVGGVFGGNIKPTPFICLVLKMLQIQPEKDIIVEFIKNAEFKYVRALGALYMRLVGTSLDCYKYLEPLLNDYRKLRRQNRNGQFELVHMDEYIDELLREERLCDIILPRLQKRYVLEENNELEPRVSALDEDMDDVGESSEEEDDFLPPPKNQSSTDRTSSLDKRRSSPESHYYGHDRDMERKKERGERERRHRSRERERGDREKKRHRSRDRKLERHRGRSRSPVAPHDRHREKDEATHRHRGFNDTATGRDREREREKDRSDRIRHHERRDRTRGQDTEIAEANALRAKLGLAPLRP